MNATHLQLFHLRGEGVGARRRRGKSLPARLTRRASSDVKISLKARERGVAALALLRGPPLRRHGRLQIDVGVPNLLGGHGHCRSPIVDADVRTAGLTQMSNATKRNTRFLVLCFICAPTVASSVHRVHLELWLRRLESAVISEARRASGNEWEEVAMRASLWFPLVVLMTPYLDPFLMSIPVVRQPHSTRSSSRDAPGAFVPIACADRKTLSPSRPRRRNRRPG